MDHLFQARCPNCLGESTHDKDYICGEWRIVIRNHDPNSKSEILDRVRIECPHCSTEFIVEIDCGGYI